MNLALVDKIAKAVLYEGYMLYPYRPSSVKNQQRWNFGVLFPPLYSSRQTGSDTSAMETQCLALASPQAELEVRVRFLQLAERPVREAQSWQETVEREVVVSERCDALLPQSSSNSFAFQSVSGVVALSALRINEQILKIGVRVENTSPFNGAGRDEALLGAMISAHIVVGIQHGHFVSMIDTPEDLHEAAAGCRNTGVWPVLIGEPGPHDAMGGGSGLSDAVLASPIILYDFPQVAPESAGDLFDGTEIDEILSLRIMTMTDEEKREMRESDERARQILERTETLPPEQLMKLHGVLRSLRPAREDGP
jgi:hydrogenase maturation protease